MGYYKSDYLYHHGILGQRWGKRNGPPYPLDAQDHSASEKKAGWKKSLEKDERRSDNMQSPNNTSSDETPKKKWSTKKKVAVGAAATVAALAAIGGMYVYKKSKIPIHIVTMRFGTMVDVSKLSTNEVILKKGTKLHRVSSKSFEDYAKDGQTIYTSYKRKDVHLYKDQIPKHISRWAKQGIIDGNGKNAYEHVMTVKNDVKIPSRRTVAEIYMKTFGKDRIDEGHYKRFMENLVDRDDPDVKRFLSAVRRSGYNALIDEHDTNWADSPLILLNPKDDIASSKSHKISAIEKFINVLTY